MKNEMKDKVLKLLTCCEDSLRKLYNKYSSEKTISIIRPSKIDYEIFDEIDLISYGTNLTHLQPISSFIEFIKQSIEGNFRIFGMNPTYSLYYAKTVTAGEIVAIDDEGVVAFNVAASFENFLDVVIEIINYEMDIVEHGQMSNEEVQRRREKCIFLSGGEKYKSYYFLLLP